MDNFFKLAAVSPKLKVANPVYNAEQIIKYIDIAKEQNVSAVCFPELCITGYTCADLFLQNKLLKSAHEELSKIVSICSNIIAIVGMPIRAGGRLYNTAVVIANGEILGVVPKQAIPNYNEYYEKRWFAPGETIPEMVTVCGVEVPASLGMVFCAYTPYGEVRYGVEICEDLWTPEPPSGMLCKMGCDIIFNPSASTEVVTKHAYRRSLIAMQSGRCICTYVYAGASRSESTTDVVFSGYTGIFENASALKEGKRFEDEQFITTHTDLERLRFLRARNTSFYEDFLEPYAELGHKFIPQESTTLDRYISPHPFVPSGDERVERLKEITSIQTSALIKRLEHIGTKKLIIGISGGVDSTLALLVAYRAYIECSWDTKDIVAVTMPGFGTTSRTKGNAVSLVNELGCTLREVDITEATKKHFDDIGHDHEKYDLTFENSQARERTQILMDIACMEGGIVLGTGDLSELALGWCTYNADHMSMYNVNCSIPKTLIKSLTGYVAKEIGGKVEETTNDILDTPISPELLPSDGENITQRTEEVLGKYDLHDFFLYHMMEGGATPKKLYYLATVAFKDITRNEDILKALKIFINRFFSQQFKRSCMPDGPKVGTVSLSPRGDLRMPSDACADIWITEVNEIEC